MNRVEYRKLPCEKKILNEHKWKYKLLRIVNRKRPYTHDNGTKVRNRMKNTFCVLYATHIEFSTCSLDHHSANEPLHFDAWFNHLWIFMRNFFLRRHRPLFAYFLILIIWLAFSLSLSLPHLLFVDCICIYTRNKWKILWIIFDSHKHRYVTHSFWKYCCCFSLLSEFLLRNGRHKTEMQLWNAHLLKI